MHFVKNKLVVYFFLIFDKILQNRREFLQMRYAAAIMVPGTRLFCCFDSNSVQLLKFKMCQMI